MLLADDRLARHNAFILAIAQALGGANPSIVVALGGLVGEALASDPGYATLPVSLLQLGLASGTIPAALVQRRLGRRTGYLIGAAVGVLSGSVAAAGVSLSSFTVFCLGTFLAGFYSAYVQSYRFAATDVASDAFRMRAISWVMAGGVAGGIVGPQTVIWTRDLLPGAPFAGAFLGQAALALVSFGVLACLRTVPITTNVQAGSGRPLSVIVRQPKFLIAVVVGLVSFGMMTFLMTAAPLAMVVECGHSVADATLGIQWHILAMFGPSFVTGRLIDRFGKPWVSAVGLVLIALAALVGLHGTDVAHFWIGLILLGIGWNFGFIGATALVTECYRPEERAKAQATNDFLVFGSVAIASFSSGKLLSIGGWSGVAILVLPAVALAAIVLGWGWRTNRLEPAPV